MIKSISTLAAAILATSALTGAAEAGGIRLSFGGPLGSFVAHPNLSSGPGGTMNRHCDKPGYGRVREYDAPARRVVNRSTPKVDVAEEQARKAQRRSKIVMERPAKPAPGIQTAKLVNDDIASDAPSIYVPGSPVASDIQGTQSTPALERAAANTADAQTDKGAAAEDATEVVVLPVVEEKKTASIEPAPVQPAEPAKAEKTIETGALASKICRRFSAAVAALVNVPCE